MLKVATYVSVYSLEPWLNTTRPQKPYTQGWSLSILDRLRSLNPFFDCLYRACARRLRIRTASHYMLARRTPVRRYPLHLASRLSCIPDFISDYLDSAVFEQNPPSRSGILAFPRFWTTWRSLADKRYLEGYQRGCSFDSAVIGLVETKRQVMSQ